jgi:hypothetical protein
VGVVVEESEEFVLEFGEFLLARESSIILEVVVEQMDCLCLEKGADFGVLMDDISEVHFINIGVESSVSDSCPEEHPGQDGQSLESQGQVPELIEEERD